MTDPQIGRAIRAVRTRRTWRQADLAEAAGVSQQTVSRIEAGCFEGVALGTLRRVTGALGMRIAMEARWEGAELDRLLGARHSAMHEEMARLFVSLPDWIALPEVTFAIFGERGAVDILAWHAQSRTLLVIELKTELADIQATIGALDRKVRLGMKIAAERGWTPAVVASWLVVAEGATNRRRVAAHRALLRAAYPDDGRTILPWLREPRGRVAALSFLSPTRQVGTKGVLAQVRRVRRPQDAPERAAD